MVIFNLILSLSPFIFLIYFLIKGRNRDSISYDINKGYKCYSCKEEIESFEDRVNRLITNNISVEDFDTESQSMCISCDRDLKLKQLGKYGFIYTITSKIDKYLLSDRSNKLVLIFVLLFIPLTMMDMFFLRDYRVFYYIAQLSQILYWILLIRKQNLNTIKKPNQ